MDTPLPENRSNLLVYVAAGAGVFALILGIVALIQIGKIKNQIVGVDLQQVTKDASDAKQAASDARASASTANSQNNPALRALATTMEREIGNQLTSIRSDIQRVEDLAKQSSARPASASSSSNGPSASSGGPAGPAPGQLDSDGTYVIKSGDTFGRIAPQFGVTVPEIIAANPGVDPRRLHVGQKIVIPKK